MVLSVEQAIEQDIMQNANFVALIRKQINDTSCLCRTQSVTVLDSSQGFQRVYGHTSCNNRIFFWFDCSPHLGQVTKRACAQPVALPCHVVQGTRLLWTCTPSVTSGRGFVWALCPWCFPGAGDIRSGAFPMPHGESSEWLHM